MKFLSHAIFRDNSHKQILPHGLQWDMNGTTYMTYLLADGSLDSTAAPLVKNRSVREALVAAHNLFAFARGSALVNDEALETVALLPGGTHVQATWAPQDPMETVARGGLAQICGAVRELAESKPATDPVEVYINGRHTGTLRGKDGLETILENLRPDTVFSLQLRLCRSANGSILSIERQFRGGIRGEEVYEHLMDNLYALEDAECPDDNTILGTATLPDWIMGGMLTSRVWVQDTGDKLIALRPLYNDNLDTADRRYQLVQGRNEHDDRRMAAIRGMMKEIRQLAQARFPCDANSKEKLKTLALADDNTARRGDRCRAQ